MILRALRLKESINQFCSAYDPAKPFSFSALEWKKIGYLADLLRPFNFFTTTIGKTTSVTLPYALSIYDELFEHLQESRRVLTKKSVAQLWVKDLIGAINAAEAKLDTYYNKTYSSLGSLYGIGAILDPKSKLKSFEEDYCWLNFKTVDWAKEFERQFRSLYDTEYKEKSTNADRLSQIREVNHDPLALALSRKRFTRDIQNPYRKDDDFSLSEVDEWLAMSMFTILLFILIFILIFVLFFQSLIIDHRYLFGNRLKHSFLAYQQWLETYFVSRWPVLE
jgi:hypothetical protein